MIAASSVLQNRCVIDHSMPIAVLELEHKHALCCSAIVCSLSTVCEDSRLLAFGAQYDGTGLFVSGLPDFRVGLVANLAHQVFIDCEFKVLGWDETAHGALILKLHAGFRAPFAENMLAR